MNNNGHIKYILYLLSPIILKLLLSRLTGELFGMYLQLSEGIDDIVELNRRFAESGLGVISTGLSCLLLCIVYIIWWRGDLHNIKPTRSARTYVNHILFGAILSILLNFAMVFVIKAFSLNGYDSTERVFFSGDIVLRIFCLGIISPFCEELLFRGLVLERLRERFAINSALIASALLFGIYHGNTVQFVYASLMGLALGYIMIKEDDIFAPFAFHAAANIAVIMAEMIKK